MTWRLDEDIQEPPRAPFAVASIVAITVKITMAFIVVPVARLSVRRMTLSFMMATRTVIQRCDQPDLRCADYVRNFVRSAFEGRLDLALG